MDEDRKRYNSISRNGKWKEDRSEATNGKKEADMINRETWKGELIKEEKKDGKKWMKKEAVGRNRKGKLEKQKINQNRKEYLIWWNRELKEVKEKSKNKETNEQRKNKVGTRGSQLETKWMRTGKSIVWLEE